MRRANEDKSPMFPSKKLDTGVTNGKLAAIDNSKVPLIQTDTTSDCGEDVENSLLKRTTNISQESETEVNSKGSDCQSKFEQQQLSPDEVKESVPLNSNGSDCKKEESVTGSEAAEKVPVKNVPKNACHKREGVGRRKIKLADRIAHRKKLTNIKLSQIIFPKCASNVLNELKKGCVYRTVKESASPRSVVVTMEHEDGLTAVGEGQTKDEAENIAAENAIKKIVLDLLENESLYDKDIDFEDTRKDERILTNLPWKELTSLALYKLFDEWQNQGVRFPEFFLSKLKVPPTGSKEGLPFASKDPNPCAILTTILPGIAAMEIERQDFPRFHVTMGYLVEGKLYSATGGTKKEAKKKAATMVLKTLYGMEMHE